MSFSTINNHINPFSKGFSQATRDFENLTTIQKIITIALSVITGLATILLGGMGGFATFKALVDNFKIEKSLKEPNSTTDKIDQVVIPKKKPDDNNISSEKFSNEKPFLNKLPNVISSDDIKNLSSEELLNKCEGISLQNTLINVAHKKMDKYDLELFSRLGKMKESEQKKLLELAINNPEKFTLVASGIARNNSHTISQTCELLELCNWPSQALKEHLLPQLISELVFKNGIAWDNWKAGYVDTDESGFRCYRLLINTQNIFGNCDFTTQSKPISSYLAKAIGLIIQHTAESHIIELKDNSKNTDKEDLRIGIEVAISQFMKTRFPASMIAPILPYIKNLPGLVSLELKDLGNGFNDEHADDLLAILNSQPLLQQVTINVDGMSEQKKKEFVNEMNEILNKRARKKPSLEEFLSHQKI